MDKELDKEEVQSESEEKKEQDIVEEVAEESSKDNIESKDVTNLEEVHEELSQISEEQNEVQDEKKEEVTSNDEIDEDKEPTKEFDIVTGTTTVKEEIQPKNNKKLFIIIVSVVLVLIIAVVLFFVLAKDSDNNDKPEESGTEVETPNPAIPNDEECKKIINEYGNKLAIYVRDQIAAGYDVANIKTEAMTNLLDGYEVKCEVFNLDNNGNIKLSNCSINGSEAIYGFEKNYSVSKPDTEYEVASKDGVLTFYYDGMWVTDEEQEEFDDMEKYTIKCEEESCVLDRYYAYYAVVKEKSGKVNVYNFYNGQKVYTALAGYEVNIMGRYNEDYEEDAFALTLRNPEKQEALYSLENKKIMYDYGVYTYDWESDSVWSMYSVVVGKYARIYKDKKTGLINSTTFEVILEPTEYDRIETSGDFIYVYKDKFEGLLRYDTTANTVTTLIKPNKYETVIADTNHILVKKSGKYGAFDLTGQTQYLDGKFYDAVVIANFTNGGALVLDGNKLKVLDLNGNLISNLGELPAGTKLYDDYETFGSGSYDDEETGVNVWLKFTNPNYDANATDAYYDCFDNCDESLDNESYAACEESCDLLYNEETSHDCIEYNYNFKDNEVEKYYMECEGGYAKPVLYLYPTLPTFITVTFDNPENLTTTYPKYESNWKVLANPNGDLYDLNGKYYYALYWEEDSNHTVDFSEGFYVTKYNAIDFLEEKLTKIGLNDKERNEFIMYWLPILESNGKSLVYFELTEERDFYSKININPTPDSLLRIAIHVKKVDSYTKIKEQKLPSFKRSGFTAVEWGGVLY